MTELMIRQTAIVSAPKAGDALPSPPLPEPKHRLGRSRRGRPRRWLITTIAVLVAALVLLLAYDSLVTGLMHDQRQRHLAADLEHGRPRIGNHLSQQRPVRITLVEFASRRQPCRRRASRPCSAESCRRRPGNCFGCHRPRRHTNRRIWRCRRSAACPPAAPRNRHPLR